MICILLHIHWGLLLPVDVFGAGDSTAALGPRLSM